VDVMSGLAHCKAGDHLAVHDLSATTVPRGRGTGSKRGNTTP
jgi:hypothetical protein